MIINPLITGLLVGMFYNLPNIDAHLDRDVVVQREDVCDSCLIVIKSSSNSLPTSKICSEIHACIPTMKDQTLYFPNDEKVHIPLSDDYGHYVKHKIILIEKQEAKIDNNLKNILTILKNEVSQHCFPCSNFLKLIRPLIINDFVENLIHKNFQVLCLAASEQKQCSFQMLRFSNSAYNYLNKMLSIEKNCNTPTINCTGDLNLEFIYNNIQNEKNCDICIAIANGLSEAYGGHSEFTDFLSQFCEDTLDGNKRVISKFQCQTYGLIFFATMADPVTFCNTIGICSIKQDLD